jgi:hypothetical protein
MPKRFSETDKWKDEWFASLSSIEKLVFLFLIDNCDNAGFFELNIRLNSFLIGISQEEYLGAIKGLNRVLLGAKNSSRFWIKNFLFHQKNIPLNIENNSHKQILGIISQFAPEFDFDFEKLGANKGLFSSIGKGKGIDNGNGTVKVEVKEEAKKTKKFVPPTMDEFSTYFQENGFPITLASRAWKGYDASNWYKSNGEAIKNWKQTCQQVWFTESNKTSTQKNNTFDPNKMHM